MKLIDFGIIEFVYFPNEFVGLVEISGSSVLSPVLVSVNDLNKVLGVKVGSIFLDGLLDESSDDSYMES